jgi:hypothetical protein
MAHAASAGDAAQMPDRIDSCAQFGCGCIAADAFMMCIKNLKTSTKLIAVSAGLLFALQFIGLEILNENPAATHSISIWHAPLLWLLAPALIYLALYAVGIARIGKIRERRIAFVLGVAGAAFLTLFWLFPMPAGLIQCFGGSGC